MLTPDPEKRIDWYHLFNHPALNENEVIILINIKFLKEDEF